MRTHYDNLKVSQDAPIEVIQAAYRTLAKKYHPDLNPNDQDAKIIMQILNTAYEVLSDPVKRQEHDAWIRKENWKRRVESMAADKSTREQEKTQKDSPEEKSFHTPPQPLSFFKIIGRAILAVFSGLFSRVAILAFIGVVYYLASSNDEHLSTQALGTPKENNSGVKDPTSGICAPPMKNFTDGSPWPKSSTVFSVREHKHGLSSLLLDNSQNNQNFLVKISLIKDSFTSNFAWEAFIPAGNKLMFERMPQGNYVVKIKDIESGCAQISQSINLTERKVSGGTEYSNISLTFYPVINGNTNFNSLSSSQF